jgi:hypothetical protein
MKLSAPDLARRRGSSITSRVTPEMKKLNVRSMFSHLRIKRNILIRDDGWDDSGAECKDANLGPHEPSLLDVDRG